VKLSELIRKYACKVYNEEDFHDKEINYGFCSDLMSDALVIMNSVEDDRILQETLLITGLTTNQSIRTAEMLDVDVVLLVRGKIPSLKVIELAKSLGVMLLSTDYTMFNVSGLMYQDGIKGIVYHQQW
jgi:hypothetical protein